MTANVFTINFRYDHLSECLSKILDERPNNSVGEYHSYRAARTMLYASGLHTDIFENISRDTKKEKYQSEADTLQVSSLFPRRQRYAR